jgi:hypothetical protein
MRFHPVDQFYGAVVLQCQSLRESLDGRFCIFRQAPNGEQQQILLRFESEAAGRGIAVAEKKPYPIPQGR